MEPTRSHLPPILASGLDVIFVGTEPVMGGRSLEVGHYYADPRNTFWRTLWHSGWTSRTLSAWDDVGLPSIGIGLTDVYQDPRGLRERLERHRPGAVCFNSREALARYSGMDATPQGLAGRSRR